DAVHAGQRLQASRAAAFAVLQKPFRFFLFGRARAFPNRPAAAIVFDPEHLASFVDHSHRILLSGKNSLLSMSDIFSQWALSGYKFIPVLLSTCISNRGGFLWYPFPKSSVSCRVERCCASGCPKRCTPPIRRE